MVKEYCFILLDDTNAIVEASSYSKAVVSLFADYGYSKEMIEDWYLID